MDTPTANIIKILLDRVASLRAEGNLEEALHAADAAVEKSQQVLSTDLDSIDAFVDALEIRAGLFLEMENYLEAVEDLKQGIDQLDHRPDKLAQMGALYSALGAAYDGQGRPDRVIDSWKTAVEYFERHEPPLMLDIATITNNLGFTAKSGGDLEAAEEFFLKSLEILHAEVGAKDAQTASVSNNLGAVYLAAGYPNQAREMHIIALETRQEIYGEGHPETAQSHNNLATALTQTGERALARQHFEMALAAFEALGCSYSDDLESVTSNYCDFLKEEGEGSLAETIEGRVNQSLVSA